MEFATEQLNVVGKGEVVKVEIDRQLVVILRRDVYNQSQRVLDYTEMQPIEAFQNIDEVWGEDPALDLYQRYKR